jgi:hypothetical protein
MNLFSGQAALFGSSGAPQTQQQQNQQLLAFVPPPVEPLKYEVCLSWAVTTDNYLNILTFQEAKSEKGVLSATFKIAQKKTILSSANAQDHRV